MTKQQTPSSTANSRVAQTTGRAALFNIDGHGPRRHGSLAPDTPQDRTDISPFQVVSVKWKGHLKQLRLAPGPRVIDIPLSACVTKGDTVRFHGGDAWVVGKNGDSQFLQQYVAVDKIRLGGQFREVVVKEITEAYEHKAYQSLADYHYRGKSIHGRTARLIVRAFSPEYPSVLGYVELATPFFMNKPRSLVLDTSFQCGTVSWDNWNTDTLRKHIHSVVRIARTVVAPEFRGAGIGKMLVKHAAKFASHRWQVSGYLPCFLEISADMLKFVPFAEKAGMQYVGETEGNLKRVAKDMRYLIKRFENDSVGRTKFKNTSGILDQQISRLDSSIALMKKEGIDIDSFVAQLQSLSQSKVLRDFALFQGIVSLPKPHYMQGLCPKSVQFLEQRLKKLHLKNGHTPPDLAVTPLAGYITLGGFSAGYSSHVRRTYRTHAVQQAFDISPEDVVTTVIRRLDARFGPGEVILVLGPSGSGKSSLLQVLEDAGKRHASRRTYGQLCFPDNYQPGTFVPIRSRKPLIDLFGEGDVRSALYLLGLAGLSEPVLYLKRFEELSRGQQYRAMLAKLIASRSNVWIADEFCANLDAATAGLVSDNVQRSARRIGATVIAAAPHCENFIRSLKPDKVILLRSSWEHSIHSGEQYISDLDNSYLQKGVPPRLLIDPNLLHAVKLRTKRAIVRRGNLDIKQGLLILFSGQDNVTVRVTSSMVKQFGELAKEDAVAAGLHTPEALKASVRNTSPGLRERGLVTVIAFELLWSETPENKEL